MQVNKAHPAYSIRQQLDTKIVFPADRTIPGRESPGPLHYTPFNGGIEDKLAIQ